MNLELLKETDNPLLERKRISYTLDYEDKTPSNKEIRSLIAKKEKAKEELIHVKHIYPRFGNRNAKVIAHIYKNLDDLKQIERIKEEKKKEVKETPQAEAPKEAKVEEKPAEAPKEEKVGVKEEGKNDNNNQI